MAVKTKLHTRWFKYDQDKLWLVYTQIVPVIFEPPCTFYSSKSQQAKKGTDQLCISAPYFWNTSHHWHTPQSFNGPKNSYKRVHREKSLYLHWIQTLIIQPARHHFHELDWVLWIWQNCCSRQEILPELHIFVADPQVNLPKTVCRINAK
jgi:hypothetical protein